MVMYVGQSSVVPLIAPRKLNLDAVSRSRGWVPGTSLWGQSRVSGIVEATEFDKGEISTGSRPRIVNDVLLVIRTFLKKKRKKKESDK